MSEQRRNPTPFFDSYPRFGETSETGPWLDRLNARYTGLIEANRDLLSGAQVLDLASHDGRFTLATLRAGAERVVGIELDHRLVRVANQHMRAYGVPEADYEFILGDVFDRLDEVEPFDVVLCFGILYHLTDHMLLLSKIAALQPKRLIIDSHVSQLEGAVVEIRTAFGVSPPPPGSHIEGHPTRAALESMLSHFGWTFRYLDWHGTGLADADHMGDYRSGKRVSLVVDCGEPVPAVTRDSAVAAVFEADEDRRGQWLAITEIAPKFGMTAPGLRFWVRRAERRRSEAGGR